MIFSLQFWNSWPTSLKTALLFFASLFLLLYGGLIFHYYNDINNILQWDTITELNQKFIATEAFIEKDLRFTNNELIYYVKEWFLPSTSPLNNVPSLILIISTLIGLSLISASLSFQNSTWFFAAILTIASFLLISRTEIVFQTISNWPFFISFLLVGGTLFLFNSFFKKSSILFRFWGIFIILLSLFLFAIRYASIEHPILAISNYSLLFPIVIFGIFVFQIAHEGMAIVIWGLSKSSEKGTSTLLSYFGLSIAYLANCLLVYLENTLAIDNSLMVISPVFLFVISTVLGFWGFKKRTEDLGIFSYRQTGIWLYLGMAIISISVLAYVYATANDSLIELLNDYIAICHLALGLVFFGHVLINFMALLKKGFDIHLVLYKPRLSRLILAQGLGFFLVGFLLIQKNIYSYSQLKSGLQNAIADFYVAEGELTTAETYYKEAVNYDLFSHKANYALADMASKVGDQINAAYFYRQAIQKNPSEFAFVGLSRNLANEDLYFDALFTLRDGLGKFPKSAILATNTAHLLEKASARDSVYFYLHQALENCWDCQTENVNMQAFWIENGREEKLDSLNLIYQGKGKLGNQLGLSRMSGNVNQQLINIDPTLILNASNFTSLYNQVTLPENELYQADSLWDELINEEQNVIFAEDLLYLKAIQQYQTNNKIAGIKQLTYLSRDSSETNSMYQRTLGLWYLQEGLYDKAIIHFNMAGDVSSVEVLENNDFKSHLLAKQKQQAEELLQINITLDNYLSLAKRAPFNAYVLVEIADFLVSKNKESEAYALVFDALEFHKTSVLLWKKYVFLSLKNGVPDYAQNGIIKLKPLLSEIEFNSFLNSVEVEKRKIQKSFDGFN